MNKHKAKLLVQELHYLHYTHPTLDTSALFTAFYRDSIQYLTFTNCTVSPQVKNKSTL